MYPNTELNITELQPLNNFPLHGPQGGTHRKHRERNLSINPSHPKNKTQVKTQSEIRKTCKNPPLTLLKPLLWISYKRGKKDLIQRN